MPLSLHSHSKRIECGFHLSRVSHYLFIDRIGWITMGKWIDERAWTVAMYICYILGFIVLSVAGYNYAMRMMGDTTLFMKVVVNQGVGECDHFLRPPDFLNMNVKTLFVFYESI